jgi:hypothetical protein
MDQSQTTREQYDCQNGTFDLLVIKNGPTSEFRVLNGMEDLLGVFTSWDNATAYCRGD